MVADDRAVGRIADGLAYGAARHHILIGRAVAAVLWIPAAEEREAFSFLGKGGTDVGVFDAGDGGVDEAEFAFDADGCVGLGVECVVVAGAAAGPNEDAVGGAGAASGAGLFGGQEHRQRDAEAG